MLSDGLRCPSAAAVNGRRHHVFRTRPLHNTSGVGDGLAADDFFVVHRFHIQLNSGWRCTTHLYACMYIVARNIKRLQVLAAKFQVDSDWLDLDTLALLKLRNRLGNGQRNL